MNIRYKYEYECEMRCEYQSRQECLRLQRKTCLKTTFFGTRSHEPIILKTSGTIRNSRDFLRVCNFMRIPMSIILKHVFPWIDAEKVKMNYSWLRSIILVSGIRYASDNPMNLAFPNILLHPI